MQVTAVALLVALLYALLLVYVSAGRQPRPNVECPAGQVNPYPAGDGPTICLPLPASR